MIIYHMEVMPSGQIESFGHCFEDTVEYLTPFYGGALVILGSERPAHVHADDVWYHFGDGQLYLRPDLALPTGRLTADGEGEMHFPCPAGTKFTLSGAVQAEVVTEDEDGLTLSTDAVGSIRISAEPPFPYKPMSLEVTVE